MAQSRSFIPPSAGALFLDDGRASRRDRFLAVKKGEIPVLLLWLIGYIDAAGARRRGATEDLLENKAFEKASAACWHKREASIAARALLAQDQALVTEDTFDSAILNW